MESFIEIISGTELRYGTASACGLGYSARSSQVPRPAASALATCFAPLQVSINISTIIYLGLRPRLAAPALASCFAPLAVSINLKNNQNAHCQWLSSLRLTSACGLGLGSFPGNGTKRNLIFSSNYICA
jgi:hypothetical protein